MLRVSCQKGPTRHAYAWQIGPFWQDTLDVQVCSDDPIGSTIKLGNRPINLEITYLSSFYPFTS